ncbi:MAG: sulfopyruvate decarboxylase subunit alpha [Nitrospirae bacterium]|nr:MAG: sulfopyruvate decarboxylase subunit alpha [Nitrospirota bacterium]
MQTVEDRLIEILKQEGVDSILALPCDRVKSLLKRISEQGNYVPLTREEEGVGIAAGIALAGGRPAMIIQSSGFGNMINALLSLTVFYQLPLAVFISHRGSYGERIQAQKPMGEALKPLLRALGIGYTLLEKPEDLGKIKSPLARVYRKKRVHVFLLSPRLWKGCEGTPYIYSERRFKPLGRRIEKAGSIKALYSRYEILDGIKEELRSEVVICNLGIPSKELYHILEQPSNFYMLGSMGMATPIGLGVALRTRRRVFVVDGDGSLLMNSGTLATVALLNPPNLTVLAIDNGVYGSTGNQPTHSFKRVDLSAVAEGFGIKEVYQIADIEDVRRVLRKRQRVARFVHIVARPGNRKVENIPLSGIEIKERFTGWLRSQ